MPYATAPDGARLYYEESGVGEPLLLISGQSSDHTLWDDIRDDFVARYRVIVYDNRGTGESDKPEDPPYSTRGFARDAIAILDHLGIPRAHAYGISMGGRICQWLGIDHGSRIGALILGATTPGNAHGVPRSHDMDAAMRAASPNLRGAWTMLTAMYSPGWSATHLGQLRRWASRKHPIPEYARRLHYLASEGHDAWDLLPTITAPTLVIHGGDDRVNPTANARLLAERIPGAELCIIPGGRHGYFVEYRAEASRAVLDFLRRHPLA